MMPSTMNGMVTLYRFLTWVTTMMKTAKQINFTKWSMSTLMAGEEQEKSAL
jgi:hypothetical protein